MFYPGGGRPKGALNYVTRALKQELAQFFGSDEYSHSLRLRIIAGTAPTIELYLLQMLYGKPRDVLEVHVEENDLSHLTTAELAERAQALMRQLNEAAELEAAIPAEFETPAPETALIPAGNTENDK